MTAPQYGYAHRGRVVRKGTADGTYLVSIPALAETALWGPVQSIVDDLQPGDGVLLTQIGLTRGDMVISGKLATAFAPETPVVDLRATWLDAYVVALTSSQPYREPTNTEVTQIVAGLQRLAQGSAYGTLLSDNGFTVTTGVESVTDRSYALARNESGTNRAWGSFLFDLSEPIRLVIEVPHPRTDDSSALLGLRHWQLVPGALLIVAGAHRDAASGLADVVAQTGSLFHKVATTWATYGVPQVQWHGYADAGAPAFQVIASSGAATPGDAVRAVADQVAGAGFTVGRGWDGTADSTGLTGTTNVQGVAANTTGTGFVYLDVNATTRADATARERLVQAVAEADVPRRALYGPFLARSISGQVPVAVGAANAVGSSPYAARADHVHAERQATLDRITAAESTITAHTTSINNNTTNISTNTAAIATNTANISANTAAISANTANISTLTPIAVYSQTDVDLYGDLLSTMPRALASNVASLVNGTIYTQRLYTRRAFTTQNLRLVVGDTAGVDGSATVGIYVGTDLAAGLSLAASAAISLTSSGLRTATLASAVSVPAGSHVVLALLPLSYSTAPQLAVSPANVAHQDLLSSSSRPTSGLKSGQSALPSTITLGDGTWSTGLSMRWMAVAA